HLVNESVESLAIVFLHSYANPTHERQARDILQQRFPDLNISISSEVSPQIREYERMSTTVTNAYVGAMGGKYLAGFDQRLKALGISCPLLMMLSNGGLTNLNEAKRYPVQLLESGPAAGAIAAAYFSARSSLPD